MAEPHPASYLRFGKGMTGEEMRYCMRLLRWSIGHVARTLDMHHANVRQMGRNARPIPGNLAAWLRAKAAGHDAPELPEGWLPRAERQAMAQRRAADAA